MVRNVFAHLSLRLKRLQFDKASSMTSASVSGVELLKLEFSAFDENIMILAAFWKRFDALHVIHPRIGVDDAEKFTYKTSSQGWPCTLDR